MGDLRGGTNDDFSRMVAKTMGTNVQFIPTTSFNLDSKGELSHSTTGLRYAMRGRAEVVEQTVGSNLAGFQDPIKAILPVQVVDAQRVIVTTREIVGGRAIIAPERAPARTVGVKETSREVVLERYGANLEMNLNLQHDVAMFKDELALKLGAQQKELERVLIELGYEELLRGGMRLEAAIQRSMPAFNGAAAGPLSAARAIAHAERIYINNCFGAMNKNAFPLQSMLAAAKHASAYSIGQPGSVLILPHGMPEMLAYTKPERMKFNISGLKTTDSKPISMDLGTAYVDPATNIRMMVHIPQPTHEHGASNPTIGLGCLSDIKTVFTYYVRPAAPPVGTPTAANKPVFQVFQDHAGYKPARFGDPAGLKPTFSKVVTFKKKPGADALKDAYNTVAGPMTVTPIAGTTAPKIGASCGNLFGAAIADTNFKAAYKLLDLVCYAFNSGTVNPATVADPSGDGGASKDAFLAALFALVVGAPNAGTTAVAIIAGSNYGTDKAKLNSTAWAGALLVLTTLCQNNVDAIEAAVSVLYYALYMSGGNPVAFTIGDFSGGFPPDLTIPDEATAVLAAEALVAAGLPLGLSGPEPSGFTATGKGGGLGGANTSTMKICDWQTRSTTNISGAGLKPVVCIRKTRVVASSAILAAPGSDTGNLLVGAPHTAVSTSQTDESLEMQLRVYLGAVLKRPESVMIMPDVYTEGIAHQTTGPAEALGGRHADVKAWAEDDSAEHDIELRDASMAMATSIELAGTGCHAYRMSQELTDAGNKIRCWDNTGHFGGMDNVKRPSAAAGLDGGFLFKGTVE